MSPEELPLQTLLFERRCLERRLRESGKAR
jgi:hypothetical protein